MAINIGTLLVELGINMGGFIEGMDKATYKAKQAGREIGESFRGLGRDIGGILSQFGEVGNVIGGVLSQTGETVGKLASQFGSLNGAAGAAAIGISVVGAVAVAAAAGVGALAIAGAGLVHELELASAKTGIAVHDLQVLQAAGSTVGVSLDAMVTGFRKFDQALIGVGRGGGAANLTLKELNINSRDNKEAMYQVADAFSKMEDGPQKAAYAVQLFGRAGLNLIPLLDKGREGLLEFEKIVDEYGPKIGVKAKEANEAYLVSQEKLTLAWDTAKVKAEESFLPTITKIVSYLADATKSVNDFDSSITKLINSYILSSDTFSKAGLPAQNKVKGILGIDDASSQKKKEGDSKLLVDALRERYDWIKAGGQAEYEVAKTEQDITGLLHLGTAAALRQAAALQSQLPHMKALAEIEKQRNDYNANPKPTALGADKEAEFIKGIEERVNKQRELAAAVNQTSGANLIETATLDAQVAISKQLIGYQGELVKINSEIKRVPTGTQQSADLLAKKNQLEDFIRALTADTPQIVKNYQEIAAATQINKANAGLDQAIDKLGLQNNALRDLSAAYDQGGEAIRRAQIEQSLSKEREEVNKAQIAYAALVQAQGAYVASLSPEKNALDEANKKMAEAVSIATENADINIENKLKVEAMAINENAKAWEYEVDAIHKSNGAKIEAARLAAEARQRATNPGSTPAEIQAAGAKGADAEQRQLQTMVQEKVAQLDLNGALRQEIDLYNRIIAVTQKNSDVNLLAREAQKKAIEQSQKEWDQAAIDVGTFRQKAAGFLNELVLDGSHFWENFGKAGIQAVSGIEDELAKMLVTGKGSFKQIEQQFEQSILKNSIQTVMSKAAGGLLSSLGLGGLIPGSNKPPSGAKGDEIHVIVENALGSSGVGGLLGKLGGGGDSGDDSGGGGGGIGGFFSGVVNFFSHIFGGGKAGGGDVTPGKMYLVGEKHPEFFVPGKAGTIVPSLKTDGMRPINMSVNFHGVTDADSFKKSQAQIMGNIHRSAAIALQRGA